MLAELILLLLLTVNVVITICLAILILFAVQDKSTRLLHYENLAKAINKLIDTTYDIVEIVKSDGTCEEHEAIGFRAEEE